MQCSFIKLFFRFWNSSDDEGLQGSSGYIYLWFVDLFKIKCWSSHMFGFLG